MADNNFFQQALQALQGAGMGFLGDPMAPVRMQMQKQALQMQMEKFQKEKEQQDLMAQQTKLHIKVLEHQLNHGEKVEAQQNQPAWPGMPSETTPTNEPTQFEVPGQTPTNYQQFEPEVKAGPPLWQFKEMGGKIENIPERVRKGLWGIDLKSEESPKYAPANSPGYWLKGEWHPTDANQKVEGPASYKAWLQDPKNKGKSYEEFVKWEETTKAKDITEQNLTPERLVAGALKEELGREPTIKEIKDQVQKEAKGYETQEEAWAISQKMVNAAGSEAALLPGVELTAQNKWIPKPVPDIGKRIPPFTPVPGMFMTNLNRKTGKYTDPTTGQEVTREEGVKRFGQAAVLNADKIALADLTKREQLIKVFTTRIDANVPIVLDAIKELKQGDTRLLNEAWNKSSQYFKGSGKWQAVQTAMLSLSNEVQRVESGQLGIGGQGQEERKIWAKIHDPNMSWKDVETLSNMILKLSKTATNVIEKQRNELIKRIPEEGIGNLVGGESKSNDPLGLR